jgi:hypothetical protein
MLWLLGSDVRLLDVLLPVYLWPSARPPSRQSSSVIYDGALGHMVSSQHPES